MSSERDLYQQGKDFALNRIGRRECSAKDVYSYLIRKKIPSETAQKIVDDLIGSKLIDNERYASLLIRHQIRQEKGPRYILQKLKSQGIEKKLNEVSQLVQQNSEQSELEMARHWVTRRYPRVREDRKEASKAIQALVRRGFSYSIANSAVLGKVDIAEDTIAADDEAQ